MISIERTLGWTLLVGLCVITGHPATADRVVDRLQTSARGIQLLWSEGKPDEAAILGLPFIHGGQVTLQWADLEKTPGAFDFTDLDRRLAWFAGQGKSVTVQVNGNHKPAWLFTQVPHIAEKLHQQVQDEQGTLMFWHPAFREAHLRMLHAVAAHLHGSRYRGSLLGIRMNFNAVGTEQLEVPAQYRNPDAWIFPAGVAREGLPAYTPAVRAAYLDEAIAVYRREFSDWTVVLVRNLIEGDLLKQLDPDLRAGRLGLFHTSSEAEPRTGGTERRYGLFYDYARAGDTVAYAEPWASAWGEHGGKLDARWCSPCQWNYWTLLFDLHCGVSFIGEYYTNLHFARSSEHPRLRDKTVAPEVQATEFMAAYEWIDAYAGRHNRPEESPGAWVAFRANTEIKAKNADLAAGAYQLTRFTGDYNFLMTRLDGDGSVGVGPAGPPEQRYGAFAREYPAGAVARLKVDSALLRTLKGGASVKVVYLDTLKPETGAVATASLHTRAGDQPLGPLFGSGSGRWLTLEFPVTAAHLAALADDFQFTVTAGAAPLTLHMVELRRAGP
jgi:hypothetical protein